MDPGGPVDTAAVAKSVAAAGETRGGASAVAVASSAATAEAAAVNPPEEALPAIHIDLLHRRTGPFATSSLQQLVKGGLIRGLEGGIVGELSEIEGQPYLHTIVKLSLHNVRFR